MKIQRINDRFIDENGSQVTWQDLSHLTGLCREESRLLLKKLAASGQDVPAETLLEWRDNQQAIWRLEKHIGLHQ